MCAHKTWVSFWCFEMNEQLNLFDYIRKPISITKPIRLIELFAGYGSQAMALKRIGAKFEHYRVVEFDKYAISSYNAVHDTDFPTMDITKVHAEDLNICDTDTFTYLLTYSFPCTDLSVAGKQAGMSKGSGTRSGLLWEVERILTEIKDSNGELPQILFMENVPQVHGKKNINDFEKWFGFLNSLGYTNYWKDLNAKNYGVAQNRNRCFMFSFLGNYSYDFPQPIQLTKRIRDYKEEVIDDKFYVSDKALKGFVEHAKKQKETGNGFHAVIKDVDDISSTIKARYYKDGSDCLIKVAGRINSSQDGKVVYTDGIALILTSGHYNVPKIAEPTIQKSYESVKLQHSIRKLTPRECGRLMGVSDEDIDKMAAVNSNTQLYKQFGNSIVVDVMCAMFQNLNINQDIQEKK